MSLYILSMWFQWDVETSRVLAKALNTSSGSFFLLSSFDMSKCCHCLKPSCPKKPMMLAYHLSLEMLNASSMSVIWPFHSPNAVCWSSECQSKFSGWKKLSCHHCAGIRLQAMVLKEVSNMVLKDVNLGQWS